MYKEKGICKKVEVTISEDLLFPMGIRIAVYVLDNEDTLQSYCCNFDTHHLSPGMDLLDNIVKDHFINILRNVNRDYFLTKEMKKDIVNQFMQVYENFKKGE